MNKWIKTLSTLGGSPSRIILGIMSGTSMDGIDLALCRVRESGRFVEVETLQAATAEVEKDLVTQFNKLAYRENTPVASILRFQAELGDDWCQKISGQIRDWGLTADEIDFLGSHGQTILHHPGRGGRHHATLQIVDGDLLAQTLGIPVISDFRQKHIAAGYEGAPLAPLAEVLLFADSKENRVLLNLGGIANFTVLEKGIDEPVVPFATDSGPANTLLDEAVKRLYPGRNFDDGGRIARTGKLNEKLFDQLMGHPFFSQPYPKSTGQEDFNWNWLNQCLVKTEPSLEIKDLLATLVEFTAKTAAMAIRENTKSDKYTIYVSGGGWKNPYLIERLKLHLSGYKIRSSEDLGVNPDIKEAVLFAVLANEVVAGKGWINMEGERFTLGKISLPG